MEQQPLIPEVVAERESVPNQGNGRPKGAANLKHKAVMRLFQSHQTELAAKLVQMALDGDTIAHRIIWDRLLPRPRMPYVAIDLPATSSPAELRGALHELVAKVARGEVTADVGLALADMLRGVLDSHRIQTIDTGAAAETEEQGTRERLRALITRAIEERQRLLPAAGEESGQ